MSTYIYLKALFPVAESSYSIGPRSNEKYYPLEFFRFCGNASPLPAKIYG